MRKPCVFTTVPTTVPTAVPTPSLHRPYSPYRTPGKAPPLVMAGEQEPLCPFARRAPGRQSCTQRVARKRGRLGAHSHWRRIRVHEYSMPRGACPPGGCPNGATSQPDTSCLTSDCGVRSRLERNKRALGHAGRAERRVSAALPLQCCPYGRDPCDTEMFVYFATVDLPPRQG